LKLVPWSKVQGTRISIGKIHPEIMAMLVNMKTLLKGLERSYLRGRSDLENIISPSFFLECLNNLKGHQLNCLIKDEKFQVSM
jgi:hypothetical protein